MVTGYLHSARNGAFRAKGLQLSCGRIAGLLTLLAALLTGGVIRAAEPNAALLQLMKILRDRGSISDEEYQALKAAAQGEASPATNAPAVPGIATAAPVIPTNAPATASSGSVRPEKLGDATSAPLTPKPKDTKWYDKIGIGGYTQLRYTEIVSQDGAPLTVFADRSVGEDQSCVLRRGRVRLSGDVTDHLYLYAQMDFAGSTGSGDLAVQSRDLYGDVSIDKEKEYRFRIGQSKVPYGWVNMQSSQNRGPMERPDALNSAADGERDIGVFFMWAPEPVRARFKSLVRDGLKGSGDYGMLTLGAYSGQGLNRSDRNGTPHYLARLTYPFLLPGDHVVEAGIQAYAGDFVTTTAALPGIGTPTSQSGGSTDRRVGVSAVWYPQPFGIEAEWNVGEGPELSSDFTRIETGSLQGGYVQLNYRAAGTAIGELFPFLRWQYYEGGRKFAVNAPGMTVNEVDLGIEWSPWPELEITAMYTHTFDRTNVRTFPYADTTSADRVAVQLQLNY